MQYFYNYTMHLVLIISACLCQSAVSEIFFIKAVTVESNVNAELLLSQVNTGKKC